MKTIIAALVVLAMTAVPVNAESPIADPSHAGEIYTICDIWYGQTCSLSGVSAPVCVATVAVSWEYYQWVAGPVAVTVGEGYHYSWTDAHNQLHTHSSGTFTGIGCVVDGTAFGYAYTYGNGVASFA